MSEISPNWRRLKMGGVLVAGVIGAVAFCALRPVDWYLIKNWERELATVSDQDVQIHLEQIAALGERSLPTLVAALHSERRVVAQTAADVLRRTLGELELLSTVESSQIISRLARELAERSHRPGPYAGPSATQLATRFLLWPIDRESIDGERLVADCELIIRSARQSSRDVVEGQGAGTETPAAMVDSGVSAHLTDIPPLPPQTNLGLNEPLATPIEPQDFRPAPSPPTFDKLPSEAADETAARQLPQPLVADARPILESRRDAASVPEISPSRSNPREMADLDVMKQLSSQDKSLAREAVDELYRRGFQTKHLRLAERLVDADPNTRLQLIDNLPQMSGIDSRPWLLWLSRDQHPAVRKAAIAVIATSPDPALMQRVRELERDETDDEVLRVVRQIANTRQSSAVR